MSLSAQRKSVMALIQESTDWVLLRSRRTPLILDEYAALLRLRQQRLLGPPLTAVKQQALEYLEERDEDQQRHRRRGRRGRGQRRERFIARVFLTVVPMEYAGGSWNGLEIGTGWAVSS